LARRFHGYHSYSAATAQIFASESQPTCSFVGLATRRTGRVGESAMDNIPEPSYFRQRDMTMIDLSGMSQPARSLLSK
jgi:hypothetical protein